MQEQYRIEMEAAMDIGMRVNPMLVAMYGMHARGEDAGMVETASGKDGEGTALHPSGLITGVPLFSPLGLPLGLPPRGWQVATEKPLMRSPTAISPLRPWAAESERLGLRARAWCGPGFICLALHTHPKHSLHTLEKKRDTDKAKRSNAGGR